MYKKTRIVTSWIVYLGKYNSYAQRSIWVTPAIGTSMVAEGADWVGKVAKKKTNHQSLRLGRRV